MQQRAEFECGNNYLLVDVEANSAEFVDRAIEKQRVRLGHEESLEGLGDLRPY